MGEKLPAQQPESNPPAETADAAGQLATSQQVEDAAARFQAHLDARDSTAQQK